MLLTVCDDIDYLTYVSKIVIQTLAVPLFNFFYFQFFSQTYTKT
jgi:hypothetical protein